MKEKEKIKDYVLMMLGAPVAIIELDECNINLCVQNAKSFLGENAKLTDVQEGAFCYANVTLARKRADKHSVKQSELMLDEWKKSI